MPKDKFTTIMRLNSAAFTQENAADCNRVFLWVNTDEPPFMGAAPGWKIVGYGTAPWPKVDWPLAVMFEKTTPSDPEHCSIRGEEMEIGTRIWQHGRAEWVPGMPEHDGRMEKAQKRVTARQRPSSA